MMPPVRDPARRRRILEGMREVSHAQQLAAWRAEPRDYGTWLSAAVRTDRIDQLLRELEAAR